MNTTTRSARIRNLVLIALGLVALLLPQVVTFDGLSPAGHRVLGIFLMAVVLWVSEAIPLHATAVLVILLEILMISDKAVLPIPEGYRPQKFSQFFYAMADPVLMLFLGGFFIAAGAAKYRLDQNLARVMLKPFGTKPGNILLGLIIVTAIFSMFMSNTATTATMIAVVIPVIAVLPERDRMRGGLALAVPVAANLGGIGTPVGTPPNAIALGALAQAGYTVSFVQWMMLAVPCMLVLLVLAWLFILKLFPCSQPAIKLEMSGVFDRSPAAWTFYAIAGVTVLLWLTEALHGINSNIVGFLPVVLLLATGVFNVKDMQSVQWHVLWLVAGGIALGTGVSHSGLDVWMVGLVDWSVVPVVAIAGVFCLIALGLGTLMSHSATANLLVPIGMTLATAGTLEIDPKMIAIFIAIGSSLAMALPISTPPNAIAYSTGTVKVKDMALVGAFVGVAGVLLFVLVAPRVWLWLGLMQP